MKRMIGFLALGLGGIGLVACLAGLIALWVVRAPVLRSSTEVFDAAGDGLKLVDEKAKRADELVGKVREIVEPVTSKIIKLADKAERTLEDEKELKRMEADLTQRLRQVDTIAETAETAVAFLNKTSRLTGLLRLPTSHNATGQSAAEGSQNSSDALSRLAKKLATLRENLAKFREDKQVQQETVDTVVRL